MLWLFVFLLGCVESVEPVQELTQKGRKNSVVSNVSVDKEVLKEDWRTQIILQENARFFSREPKLLAYKFSKMSSSEYKFMRGSLSLYLKHLEQNPALKTSFLQTSGARKTPIFGDAHPENLTIYLDLLDTQNDGKVLVEFSDLDSADYGPWLVDLRRSAMAFRLFYDELLTCECDLGKETACDLALKQFWEGYQAGLNGEQNNGKVFWEDSEIIQKRVKRARNEEKGAKKLRKKISGDKLDKKKQPNGQPKFKKKGVFPVSESQQEQARFIINQVLNEEQSYLDMAQIYGKGVSSVPAIRYFFLWKEAEQQKLGTAREVFPPPQYPWSFKEDESKKYTIERMDKLREFLWTKYNADPNYKLVVDRTGKETTIFKFQTESESFKDIDLDKVEEWLDDEEIKPSELPKFARVVGYVLGRSHGKGIPLGVSDRRSRGIILEDIRKGGGLEAVWAEIEKASCAEMELVKQDYEWFSANHENLLELAKP